MVVSWEHKKMGVVYALVGSFPKILSRTTTFLQPYQILVYIVDFPKPWPWPSSAHEVFRTHWDDIFRASPITHPCHCKHAALNTDTHTTATREWGTDGDPKIIRPCSSISSEIQSLCLGAESIAGTRYDRAVKMSGHEKVNEKASLCREERLCLLFRLDMWWSRYVSGLSITEFATENNSTSTVLYKTSWAKFVHPVRYYYGWLRLSNKVKTSSAYPQK